MESPELRDQLESNTAYFRSQMEAAGFSIQSGAHPIVPIMLGDARLAHDMAQKLLQKGIYVIAFSYPVRCTRLSVWIQAHPVLLRLRG